MAKRLGGYTANKGKRIQWDDTLRAVLAAHSRLNRMEEHAEKVDARLSAIEQQLDRLILVMPSLLNGSLGFDRAH